MTGAKIELPWPQSAFVKDHAESSSHVEGTNKESRSSNKITNSPWDRNQEILGTEIVITKTLSKNPKLTL